MVFLPSKHNISPALMFFLVEAALYFLSFYFIKISLCVLPHSESGILGGGEVGVSSTVNINTWTFSNLYGVKMALSEKLLQLHSIYSMPASISRTK